jgi:uncharacterized protein (DUF2249 family)
MISADMTVGRLLEERPDLIEVLVSQHPRFAQLCDRRRRAIAARVTLAEAAGMAGMPVDELLARLGRVAHEGAAGAGPGMIPAPASASRPDVPVSKQVHLDVREDIRRGQEPLARIMAAVKSLGVGQVLVLRAPFEPVPLYGALGRRGFAHWTERRADDDWSIWFHRVDVGESAPSPTPAGPASRVIDVRGLEPPEPMVRVLEALERLEPGGAIEVLHERRPLFLYPQLDARGFAHETDEPEPGAVRIVIRHGGAAG